MAYHKTRNIKGGSGQIKGESGQIKRETGQNKATGKPAPQRTLHKDKIITKGKSFTSKEATPRTKLRNTPAPASKNYISKSGTVLLYGKNSVLAALANPNRVFLELHGDPGLAKQLIAQSALPERYKLLDHAVPEDRSSLLSALAKDKAPHQHIAALVKCLPAPNFDQTLLSLSPRATILILDHVSDPQNIGAAMRVAAGLGAAIIITQDRHSPPETGALARASAGALERLPWVRVNNLSRALEHLKHEGFWIAGLDGAANTNIGDVSFGERLGLVLGSEGDGIRPLVKKQCDHLLKIPMTDMVESLNVSVAAGIALYALKSKQSNP